LGPYQAWFPGIQLSRDFERVKVPGNPMKSPFCSVVFWGQILSITICARRQPNNEKHLLIGLNNQLKENYHLLGSPPGAQGSRAAAIFGHILPPISGFCPLAEISARG
jgi:hypothetical protein